MNEFHLEVKVSCVDEKTYDSTIESTGKKIIYNLDNLKAASSWLRDPIKNKKTFDAPQLSNAITCKKIGVGSITKDSLGYIQNNANSPYYNLQFISLFSGNFSGGHGCSVDPENFRNAVAMFTARKTIKPDWLNCKDEYMAPNESHQDYEQWNNDAIVYSLFNTSSNQSSLRNVDYKDKVWQIENQWFWMSRKEMMSLADSYKNNDLYKDAKKYDQDRHVYNFLKSTNLSKDAKELLEMANDLVRESFKHREAFNEEHPEYQVNNWDAGWYQIKAMLKVFMKEKLDKFNELYKAFENRMREGVYKFGFLKE